MALVELGEDSGLQDHSFSKVINCPCSLALWIKQSYNALACLSLFNEQNRWISTTISSSPLFKRQMLGNLGYLTTEILVLEKEKSTAKMSVLWCLCSDTEMPGVHKEKVDGELQGQKAKVITASTRNHLSQ